MSSNLTDADKAISAAWGDAMLHGMGAVRYGRYGYVEHVPQQDIHKYKDDEDVVTVTSKATKLSNHIDEIKQKGREMSEIMLLLIVIYLCFGIILMAKSTTRGWRADVQFIFTWGIHLIQHWRGKERKGKNS